MIARIQKLKTRTKKYMLAFGYRGYGSISFMHHRTENSAVVECAKKRIVHHNSRTTVIISP